jgi:ribose 5-phosphate isomerase A
VATSVASARLAEEAGIYVTGFAECPTLDLVVDGADEVTPELDLIKGLGGALVREKIVAKVSRRVVIVVDESKLVERLGERAPVPVEIVPFARELVAAELERIAGRSELRMRDDAVFVSDNGNHILDWYSGPIADPGDTERRLKSVSGVVESGIFSSLADRVIVAGAAGLRTLDRPRAGAAEG